MYIVQCTLHTKHFGVSDLAMLEIADVWKDYCKWRTLDPKAPTRTHLKEFIHMMTLAQVEQNLVGDLFESFNEKKETERAKKILETITQTTYNI